MPVLLAYVIGDSTDIFGISGGGFEPPKPPPSVRHCRRGRYLHNTQQAHETNTHAPIGIRTCDPRKRTPENLHLKQQGHRDRRVQIK